MAAGRPADVGKAAAAVAGQRIIAITAAACRSPCEAITSVDAVDAITATPLQRWDWDLLAASGRAASEVIMPSASVNHQQLPARFGGWLSDIELFDASAFGISNVEAMLMDVQQRLLLQLSWNALSAAAATASHPITTTTHRASSLSSSAGGSPSCSINVLHPVSGSAVAACIAVGIASAEYNNWLLRRTDAAQTAYSATGGALSVASGRLAYMFGMKGPALSVDTACSSSLVAAHYVAQQLGSGASSAGFAAGVGILLSPEPTSMFQKAGMLAPGKPAILVLQSAPALLRSKETFIGMSLFDTTCRWLLKCCHV
jgi:acyl transferase domain-containing protein